MQTRKPARVLPDPVGAAISVSRPGGDVDPPLLLGRRRPLGEAAGRTTPPPPGGSPPPGAPEPPEPREQRRSVGDSHHSREYRPGGTATGRDRAIRRATRVGAHAVGPRNGHWARPVSGRRPAGGGSHRLLGAAGPAVPAGIARPWCRLPTPSAGRRGCWPTSTSRWASVSGGSSPGAGGTSSGPAPPSMTDLDALEEVADGHAGPLKVRIVGPWTLVGQHRAGPGGEGAGRPGGGPGHRRFADRRGDPSPGRRPPAPPQGLPAGGPGRRAAHAGGPGRRAGNGQRLGEDPHLRVVGRGGRAAPGARFSVAADRTRHG